MRASWRGALVYVLILMIVSMLLLRVFPMSQGQEEVTLSKVVQDIGSGQVKSIAVSGDELAVTYKDGNEVMSRKEAGTELTKSLKALGVDATALDGVDLQVKPTSAWGQVLAVAGSILPLVLVAVLFLFLMRQAQGTNNQAIAFGRSVARLIRTKYLYVFLRCSGVCYYN